MVLRGMYGIGDCLHQRAIIRDLLDTKHSVVLETFYWSMYDDLVRRGLRLRPVKGIAPRIHDTKQAALSHMGGPINRPMHYKITYDRESIHRHGSILAAQYASIGMEMPARPDFGMTVPQGWRLAARQAVGSISKPLMVYRPSVLNNVWRSNARAPDPAAYAELYRSIRSQFHVVSIAKLGDKGEHIDGPEMDADLKLHRGELAFEELAGLFAEARMVFACPGFAPILAQMVGTPVAIVYGGNESFATTNSVGAHLAPTLAIEPVEPCACHLKNHDCNKYIDLPPAIERLGAFAARCVS